MTYQIRTVMLVAALSLLAGCGYTSRDGEATGQAKKVARVTPIFCDGYMAFDMSLGVMRGGTGSMSTQDAWFTVADERVLATLKKAVETAAVVKVRYDTRRVAFCTETYILRDVEIVQ